MQEDDVVQAVEISFESVKEKLTDNPNLKFKDISDESYRVYQYPTGAGVTIYSPLALHVHKSSSSPTVGSPDSHMIYDQHGISHYVPAGWVHLTWYVKEGKKAFAF